jgi:hypothetical protein
MKNKTLIYLAVGAVAYYFIWKSWKNKQSQTIVKNPNEPTANAVGGSGIGGVVIPKGKTPELLMSSPGVCGWYYENDEGDLVFIQSAPCPAAV